MTIRSGVSVRCESEVVRRIQPRSIGIVDVKSDLCQRDRFWLRTRKNCPRSHWCVRCRLRPRRNEMSDFARTTPQRMRTLVSGIMC